MKDLGFTHVELLPIAEYPFGGSWGYQVGNYYAPTARYGHPDDLRHLVDHLHQEGIGVLVDWVPGHFPRDVWGLGRFDGTALYEHADPRQGEQPDWGTYVFNFGRNEVRNFLVANAHFWIEQYHVDGLRVDAVASMLYLDYSRPAGGWVPNRWGGRENEEAIAFLRELTTSVQTRHPGVHDHRRGVHRLAAGDRADQGGRPRLHPQVEHGVDARHAEVLRHRSAVPRRAPQQADVRPALRLQRAVRASALPRRGGASQRLALRADAWAAGAEAAEPPFPLRLDVGPPRPEAALHGRGVRPAGEWNHDQSLDWHLLAEPERAGVQDLIRTANRLYAAEPALHLRDDAADGFRWIQADSASVNVYAFLRAAPEARTLACIANLADRPWSGYRVGLPLAGEWTRVLDTDAVRFGGRGRSGPPAPTTEAVPWDGFPQSVLLDLPPLTVQWLAAPESVL